MKKKIALLMLAIASVLSIEASQPKYIFYFIGDGMGMGQVMASQTYNRVALGSDEPLLMMQFPYAGMLETFSASRIITDSAAAGTALATGHKTKNGMLGMNPDTVAVTSMAEKLHNEGWGVGLVTTVAPDDATPGAFYAHVPSRKQYYDIGRQAAESNYEFIAGANWRGAIDRQGNDTGLYDYMRSHGVELHTDAQAAKNSSSERVFLYSATPFSDSNVGFTIDSIPGMLTLQDMTDAALTHLQRVSPEKFFIMVEGGNIDYAGHGNDGAAVAIEVHNFNKALRHAYDFYLQHPDETVIIVTADHETGGLSLGNNTAYNVYPGYFSLQTMSKDAFSAEVKNMLKSDEEISWDQFKEFASAKTGLWKSIAVNEKQEALLKGLFDEVFEQRKALADEKTLYSSFNVLANEVYKVLNANQGFGWTTDSHSGNPVPVYSIGRGMEYFGALHDNTHIAPYLYKLATGKEL